jgi:hypothetical protein
MFVFRPGGMAEGRELPFRDEDKGALNNIAYAETYALFPFRDRPFLLYFLREVSRRNLRDLRIKGGLA